MTPARRPYVRPMKGWWNRDPFFMRYMVREVTALGVLVYAVILAWGLLRLSQGEAAWNAYVAALRSPLALALHLVLLLNFVVHAQSWFGIMPKTMAPLMAGGKRVPAATITRIGIGAAVVATIIVLLLCW